jgi:protein-S-isoprenylcysteine O-methyltransferase Ste14
MQWLELKIPPLLVSFAFAVAMLGLAHATPGLSISVVGAHVAAFVLAATGAVVAGAGVIAFRQRRTTVNPLTPAASSSVVSTSIYGFSRNPMYLGFLLALAGWAVYLSNVAAALLLPAFVAYMNQYQVKPEERALLAKFGPEFAHYMSRVRRWI